MALDSDFCGLCNEGTESADHLFTGCSISMGVWDRFSEWLKLPNFFAFSISDLLVIHEGAGGDRQAKEIVRGLVLVTCWVIWKARNNRVFSNGSEDSNDSFGEVRSLGFFWLRCRSKHSSIVWRDWCSYPLYML
ncbi:hypothetical protein HanHA300_Chr17g0646851 [Helianthus annuus]|nr:hypothetical protein HanHA300_Chr17g0646851 [Helianthus annuus]KAJ0446842.1 hypothetical protein HanHA89_Chr17g0698751 [Helianthus annuus]KAJ0631736.1 hypothetical protein HanLR1_Chr17g0657301 [Helianthus annuus]